MLTENQIPTPESKNKNQEHAVELPPIHVNDNREEIDGGVLSSEVKPGIKICTCNRVRIVQRTESICLWIEAFEKKRTLDGVCSAHRESQTRRANIPTRSIPLG